LITIEIDTIKKIHRNSFGIRLYR